MRSRCSTTDRTISLSLVSTRQSSWPRGTYSPGLNFSFGAITCPSIGARTVSSLLRSLRLSQSGGVGGHLELIDAVLRGVAEVAALELAHLGAAKHSLEHFHFGLELVIAQHQQHIIFLDLLPVGDADFALTNPPCLALTISLPTGSSTPLAST